MDDAKHTEAIRLLNDQLRQNLSLGVAVMTVGVAALGAAAVEKIVRTIATFDDFSRDNDPYGEHDFGAFDAAGVRIFIKIDYYDKKMEFGSPNPADPLVTTRVITVMLASEY